MHLKSTSALSELEDVIAIMRCIVLWPQVILITVCIKTVIMTVFSMFTNFIGRKIILGYVEGQYSQIGGKSKWKIN